MLIVVVTIILSNMSTLPGATLVQGLSTLVIVVVGRVGEIWEAGDRAPKRAGDRAPRRPAGERLLSRLTGEWKVGDIVGDL